MPRTLLLSTPTPGSTATDGEGTPKAPRVFVAQCGENNPETTVAHTKQMRTKKTAFSENKPC